MELIEHELRVATYECKSVYIKRGNASVCITPNTIAAHRCEGGRAQSDKVLCHFTYL